jgi:hypothetical protein
MGALSSLFSFGFVMDKQTLEDFETLCALVGYVSIQWASIEQDLDYCVAASFHGCGGADIREDLPVSLEAKIDYLKKAYRRLPPLHGLVDEALPLLTDLKVFAQNRHDLVHGVINGIEHEGGVYTFLRTEYNRTIHSQRKVLVDVKAFPALAKELAGLLGRALNLADHTIQAVYPEKGWRSRHP